MALTECVVTVGIKYTRRAKFVLWCARTLVSCGVAIDEDRWANQIVQQMDVTVDGKRSTL
jgi:hypothetical protein